MKYPKYQDPAAKVNNPPAQDDSVVKVRLASWLGRFEEQGWSVKILPPLTPQQWQEYATVADDAWDPETKEYEKSRAYDLFRALFPDHTLEIYVCPCEGEHPHKKSTVPNVLKNVGTLPKREKP